MIDELSGLLQKQATELIGANACSVAEELGSAEDGKLSVSVGFKIALIGNRIVVASGIGYARKFKDETEGMVELPDPDQPKLNL